MYVSRLLLFLYPFYVVQQNYYRQIKIICDFTNSGNYQTTVKIVMIVLVNA